jgi:polysaccharide pyruvyl transferase WcaK-like protein
MWRSQAVRAERMMLTRSRLRNYSYSDATAYTDAVLQADAVVSSGGGFITDEFPFMVEGVCGVLAMAQRHNKPTAMFGQGLGPLLNPALIARAREAFPNLSVLGLREPVASPKVAKELGAPVERTKVTGDDATLLSFREKKAALGDAIGFNVRVTEYSGISEEDLSKLRGELQTIATETKAPFMPVIVGHFKGEDQNSSALLPPNHPVLDLPMNSPSDAISAISNCRLVLTGSYHGAVFALGQGIPVIGVAKSSYYQGKFEGLKALYPEGISVIGMSDLMETGNLSSRIIQLHENASGLRDVILHKSEEISKASAKLYTDFFETFAASK